MLPSKYLTQLIPLLADKPGLGSYANLPACQFYFYLIV